MSKNIMIVGAALIALALFWKPLVDMLNGLVGGGFDGQYFEPRDTSRGQVGAYDPPNENPITFEQPNTPQEVDTGPGIVDKQPAPNSTGDSTPVTDEGAQKDQTWGEYLRTPEGAISATFVAATAAPIAVKAGKPIATKAYKVLKETAPKAKEVFKKGVEVLKKEAPKAIEVGKKVIKSPYGKAGLAFGAWAAIDEGIARYTGKQSVLDGLLNNQGSWTGNTRTKSESSAPSTPYTPTNNPSIKSSNSSNARTPNITKAKRSNSSGGGTVGMASGGSWSVSKGGNNMPPAGTKIYTKSGQDLSTYRLNRPGEKK